MRGVAVPYIIALILGVAVIRLVGYWFTASGGKFSGQSAKTICDNKFLQWCITTGRSLASFIASNTECSGLVSYQQCDNLIGGSSGGPTQCGGQGQQCCPPGNRCSNSQLSCNNNGICQPTVSPSCKQEGIQCIDPRDTTCCSGLFCVQERGDPSHTCKPR